MSGDDFDDYTLADVLALMIACAITAPICWNIETIALPVAVCSGARLTVAEENNVGIARQAPAPTVSQQGKNAST